MAIQEISRHCCFGGWQLFLSHASQECAVDMRFSVFLPPAAERGRVPVLYYLAGLTCTEETFMVKAGAQRPAAEAGIALVTCDTSPRGTDIPGQGEAWDFGLGAGFYVDATQTPWSQNWRMYSYITRELPLLVAENFPVDLDRQGIFGHSMGGHGALVCALRNPEAYRSVSAFAPIAAPIRSPWGKKAFSGYLGDDQSLWAQYDASMLVAHQRFPSEILIDQGLNDQFLTEQLHPHLFEDACRRAGQEVNVRRQAGYDHGYYFIQTFIPDHIRHHARRICD